MAIKKRNHLINHTLANHRRWNLLLDVHAGKRATSFWSPSPGADKKADRFKMSFPTFVLQKKKILIRMVME
jgi:hypothetical protein